MRERIYLGNQRTSERQIWPRHERLNVVIHELVCRKPFLVTDHNVATIGRRRRQRHQKSATGRRDCGRMGNESSVPVDDDVPPQSLESRTLNSVAKYIKENQPRRIVVMVSTLQFCD